MWPTNLLARSTDVGVHRENIFSSNPEVYREFLLPLKHGYPLYHPDPSSSDERYVKFIEEGVEVGDVGVLRENGSFDFLFSVCKGDRNQRGAPNGLLLFDEAQLDVEKKAAYRDPQSVITGPTRIGYAVHEL